MLTNPPPRLIMFHQQATSARTRFLRLPHGGVCAFGALPAMSQVVDEPPDEGNLLQHPGRVVHDAEAWLGMDAGSLEAEGNFKAWVDVPGSPVQVFLARFTTIDPPFDEVGATSGSFIDLTQARGLPVAELGLLRRAYEFALGG